MQPTDYASVRASVFATATVPDGYFGETAVVGIAMIGTAIVAVANCGYYRLGLPDAIDQAEAMWLLHNHPTARNITHVREVAA